MSQGLSQQRSVELLRAKKTVSRFSPRLLLIGVVHDKIRGNVARLNVSHADTCADSLAAETLGEDLWK